MQFNVINPTAQLWIYNREVFTVSILFEVKHHEKVLELSVDDA